MKKYLYEGFTSKEIPEIAENWKKNVLNNARYIWKKNNIPQGKYLSDRLGVDDHYFVKLKGKKNTELLNLKFLASLCKDFGYTADMMLDMDLQEMDDNNDLLIARFLKQLRNNTLVGELHWEKRVNMVPYQMFSKIMDESNLMGYCESRNVCTCKLPDDSKVRIILFENGDNMKYEVQINGIPVASTFCNVEFDMFIEPIVNAVFGFKENETKLHESVENIRTINEIMKKYIE